MATDEEILKLWGGSAKKKEDAQAIVRLYRLAENTGRQEGSSALEKEILTDATIEAAYGLFGFGKRDKRSTITQRAIMREAFRIAREKAGK